MVGISFCDMKVPLTIIKTGTHQRVIASEVLYVSNCQEFTGTDIVYPAEICNEMTAVRRPDTLNKSKPRLALHISVLSP